MVWKLTKAIFVALKQVRQTNTPTSIAAAATGCDDLFLFHIASCSLVYFICFNCWFNDLFIDILDCLNELFNALIISDFKTN